MRPMSSRVTLAVAAVAAMMPMAWAADPAAVADGAVVPNAITGWRPLFDGRTLGDWQPTPFGAGRRQRSSMERSGFRPEPISTG